MQAIAVVTMAFLPLATIAVRILSSPSITIHTDREQAVFGSQFFNFDTESRKILVASDFWIFWALIGALTITVALMYYYLNVFRGTKRDYLNKLLKLKHLVSS